MTTTYQGPNVSVTQQFITSPGAIAVEDIPSAIIATAFDVYLNELIGSLYGIKDNTLEWGVEKVVYNKNVINKRAYDFYPVKVKGSSPFGNIDLDIDSDNISEDGVSIGYDDNYIVPNTEQIEGECEGIIPYYRKEGVSGEVKILASDLKTILITDGAVVTSKIKTGQNVFINISDVWTFVGTVANVSTDETKINLQKAYSAAILNGEGIVVGAHNVTTIDVPNTLYDVNAKFVTNKVKVGDVLYLSSLAISDSVETPIQVSVTSILNENTLKFNTVALDTGRIDYSFTQYKTFDQTPFSTLYLSYYSIKRYLGFSQNYGLKLDGDASMVERINDYSFSITDTGGLAPVLVAGDLFLVTTNIIADGVDERTIDNIRLYRINTIVKSGEVYTITTDSIIYKSVVSPDDTKFITGDFLTAWHPKIESDILVDFRAVRTEEIGVVKRIASLKDITDAWSNDGSINLHNELAFMASAAFSQSGQQVLYGVHVDATENNLSEQYAEALEELKLYDVYSHAFGTTDVGVNALAGPYCDEQSEPYEGHERIATVVYDENDIYLMGSDDGSIDESTGIITINGSFDPVSAGITVNDIVEIYDVDGELVEIVNVIATPDSETPFEIQTDYSGDSITTPSFKFMSGRKDNQAIKIAAIDYGNRRVKVLWPGWFYGYYNSIQYLLPPYYISAAIVGLDSGTIVSQSFTNMNFSIPGISNILLKTNHYFKKLQLDEIGGSGVDIMIQDVSPSQSIKSRHDLTSNMDAVEYREHSITKQADVAAKTLRSAINPYVGKYNITNDLLKFIASVCGIVSTTLTRKGILQSLYVKSIARDEVIADKINIVCEATVFVAGNYYDITLIIKSR
jgi:hypothetical protein